MKEPGVFRQIQDLVTGVTHSTQITLNGSGSDLQRVSETKGEEGWCVGNGSVVVCLPSKPLPACSILSIGKQRGRKSFRWGFQKKREPSTRYKIPLPYACLVLGGSFRLRLCTGGNPGTNLETERKQPALIRLNEHEAKMLQGPALTYFMNSLQEKPHQHTKGGTQCFLSRGWRKLAECGAMRQGRAERNET